MTTNESIRIKTTPGVNKNINIKLEQDFNFLEILSLKISQEDVYSTFCANYGVVVGRIIANRGFGIPNAKVSVFIPITDEDQKNQLVKDLYPFKTAYQKNKRSIRYNLLPSKTTCVINKAVGTFPTKEDVLDNSVVLEIFDKYYKYTTTTNSAGDYMIFGVPTGQQTVHMDVDLSDIGAFSVRPYDLIAAGYPEKLFDSNAEFKVSTNLDSLPQIKTNNVGVTIIPFWGEPGTCEIGINRVDIDTGVELVPTALFFGSIFTDNEENYLSNGCIPDNNQGEQNNLKTGAGTINMVRVSEINPNDWVNNKITPSKLEYFDVEGGELIDDDGVFTVILPMNIGHVVTDENGVLVPSPDPSVGVATKAMYRFKMKFNDEGGEYRTGTMFFPSLGQSFGGTQGIVNTGLLSDANGTEDQRWTDDICQYNIDSTKCGGTVYKNSRIFKDFHTFEWKQLYTIAHYIKKFKKGITGGGTRFSFLGVKNTDRGKNNLFPYNNAIWKFSILYYILTFLVDVIAGFIKFMIFMTSFEIGFCIYAYLTLLGVTFNLNDCWSFKPLSWVAFFFPSIGNGTTPLYDVNNQVVSGRGVFLPCEGLQGQQNGTAIVFDNCNQLKYCNGTTGAGCNLKFNKCGSGGSDCFKIGVGVSGWFDTSDANNPKQCAAGLTIGTAGNLYNNGNTYSICNPSACLKGVNDWVCCIKPSIAEDLNVIRRNFNDAWVFGTAYLFRFENDVDDDKFCGPGADNWRADNYLDNNCCDDNPPPNSNCEKCLLRGPTETMNGNKSGYHRYHHNEAILQNKVGSKDINDIIYCNALMSTKIVSLGRVEMCEYTLNDIENIIKATKVINTYNQDTPYQTGTFYEDGWDPGYWILSLNETSYQNPKQIIQYINKKFACDPPSMFDSTYGCHEYEFNPTGYYIFKEGSKLYNKIELVIDSSNTVVFNPNDGSNNNPNTLISNTPLIYVTKTPTTQTPNGGYRVSKYSANRFSPCGDKGNCLGVTPLFDGTTKGLWDGGNVWPLIGTPPYEGLSNNDVFDKIINPSSRNNQNTRANIPYYYFGLNPGKTAITKLRKKFFVVK